MIISNDPSPSMNEFQNLMRQTDIILNNDANQRQSYYKSHNGTLLEDDVLDALNKSAVGTSFEHTIEKISGTKFPDIVAAKLYGVEVKSTKENHWTTTGGSILETTRVDGVERIYMTFGKLGGNPIEFISKPYESCLSGIAVTHMPRYLIDMKLSQKDTIFDKMGVSYDELRIMDDPIAPVIKFYKNRLKPGERLWWMGDEINEVVPATIKLWKNLSKDEKRFYTVYGLVNFPEVFCGDYNNYALWLTSQGVVDPHIRDQFSAGGKEKMLLSNGLYCTCPAVYRKLKLNLNLFMSRMCQCDTLAMCDTSNVDSAIVRTRLLSWSDAVSKQISTLKSAQLTYEASMDVLSVLFKLSAL